LVHAGEWPLPEGSIYEEPIKRVASAALGGGATAVLEDAIVMPDRDLYRKLDEVRGLRALFRRTPDGYETFVVVDRSGLPEALDLATRIAGGTYRVVGVISALPPSALPANGSDLPDDLVRRVAEAATHVFFRNASYDGLVVWTAPGAEPKGFFGPR
jgi:hypothetical protein